MLYTGKGDGGETGTFGCDQRISKSSKITEALGALDETNSFLGLCKANARESKDQFYVEVEESHVPLEDIINNIQENLFIIQAQVAGASKVINDDDVKGIENIINFIEKQMPPIKSFFIGGGSVLSSEFDFARTIARRAERRVVSVSEDGNIKVGENTLAYLNRLSSLLYALARFVNFKLGVKEKSPKY